MAGTNPIKAASVKPQSKSGTITLGGTAQAFLGANAARSGFWLQNNSAGDLWISEVGTAAAAQPSLRIAPGQLYESPITGCPTTAVSIYGATTAQAFTAREW